jgi:hypothetical protein
VRAIKQVFPNTKGMKMNATKSMIGHCLGAAGGMEAIATIKVRWAACFSCKLKAVPFLAMVQVRGAGGPS